MSEKLPKAVHQESKPTESLAETLARIQCEQEAEKGKIIDAEFEEIVGNLKSYEGEAHYAVPALQEPQVIQIHPESVESAKKPKSAEERLEEIRANLERNRQNAESQEKSKGNEGSHTEKPKNNKETIKNNPEAGAKDKKKEKRAKQAAFVRTAGKETLRGAVGVGLLAGAAIAIPSVASAIATGPIFGPVNETLLTSLHLSSMPLVGFLLADSFLSYVGIRLIAGLPEFWNDITADINKRFKFKIPQFKVKNKKYT